MPFPEGFVAWVAAVGYFNISQDPAHSSKGSGALYLGDSAQTAGLPAVHSHSSAPAQSKPLVTLNPSE